VVLREEEFKGLGIADKARYINKLKALRGRGSLMYLAREVLGYSRIEDGVHGKLVDLLSNGRRRKLVLLPRGSFKSSIATISYSIWRLLNDVNLRILIDSEVLDNSERFVGQIKKHLRDVSFTSLYGEMIDRLERETSREFTLKTRTDRNLKNRVYLLLG
jgi:hypothetical protein